MELFINIFVILTEQFVFLVSGCPKMMTFV